jgi:hypothetical protein
MQESFPILYSANFFVFLVLAIANRIRLCHKQYNGNANKVNEMDVALLMLSIWGLAALVIFAE